VGGSFDDYEVRSIIGHQPFANPDVQLRAMALDPSFVLHPPATAQVFAQVDDENNQSSLMMDISYVRDDQVREVTFFLEDRQSADAHITAKLTFDTNIGDGKKGDVGSLTLENKDDKHIHFLLEFFKPWKSKAKDNWHFEPWGDGSETKVTWQNSGDLPWPMARLMGPMINKNLNHQFETGLSNLKKLVEG